MALVLEGTERVNLVSIEGLVRSWFLVVVKRLFLLFEVF
jgi:hypothetical protein